MNSRRQSIGSNASTTLSSFVKKRFNGHVPIFGGDVRTGIAEATCAISNSVQTNLATALLSMSQALVSIDQSGVSTLTNNFIDTNNQLQQLGDDCSDLLKCAQLDDDQLRLLLEASIITTYQVQAYKVLIYASYDVVRKKKPPTDILDVRLDEVADMEYLLTDDELERLAGDKLGIIKQYAKLIGFTQKAHVNLVTRAFICDEVVKAKFTNRLLATVGNASLTVILRKNGYMLNTTIGRMSYLTQKILSNRALYEVGMRAKLQNMIVADNHNASSSIAVIATTVEALFGIAEMVGGEEFVLELNNKHLRVCDFENLF